jgi:hypothetical protein
MTPVDDRRQLRSFGLLVGAIFFAIGLWPAVVRGDALRLWALVPGIALILAGLIAPRILRPIHRKWMGLAHVLGWVNTRVLLGLIFFGLITPVGLIRRLMGKDPLARAFKADASTYRVPQHPRSRTHLTHQY